MQLNTKITNKLNLTRVMGDIIQTHLEGKNTSPNILEPVKFTKKVVQKSSESKKSPIKVPRKNTPSEVRFTPKVPPKNPVRDLGENDWEAFLPRKTEVREIVSPKPVQWGRTSTPVKPVQESKKMDTDTITNMWVSESSIEDNFLSLMKSKSKS